MKSIAEFDEIYLYRRPVDMRKYRNGLCAIVETKMKRSLYSRDLFIFTNRRRNIIRFLYWDATGFAVWSKTLDKQKYKWPETMFDGNNLLVSSELLHNLLQGMDITVHKMLEFKHSF